MLLQNMDMDLILASGSKGRADILNGTGLQFSQIVADVDEAGLRDALYAKNENVSPEEIAMVLGKAKAEIVSQSHLEAYVIGADQVLDFQGKIYEKPASIEQARENLLAFKGGEHYLHSAVCVFKNGVPIFEHIATATMTIRDFSEEFLDKYLEVAGDSVKTSVGAYRLEETGIHMFEAIEGDYFTILGLPVLPLLAFLRKENLVIS